MTKIDLNALSPEQLASLESQLDAKKQADKDRIRDDREAYKEMKDATVRTNFELLKQVSGLMMEAKNTVFGNTEELIELKDDLFKTKSDRRSDSLSTEDGKITLKLGNRISEGWADEVEIGVAKVREYLKTLAKDENSADLVDTVMNLLAKDRSGKLKASKVLELEKLATKSGNESFLDGIAIIKDAYRPTPSCQFIEVRYKDENDKERSLPLSMSSIIVD